MAALPHVRTAVVATLAIVCAGIAGPDLRAQKPAASDLPARIAEFTRVFISGFTNVVAQEDFELRRPKKNVRSDVLLVRYPGTKRDLLVFRDVTSLNGIATGAREDRLMDLFLRPAEDSFRRANEISSAAQEHVPSVFNPLFVIGFFQADFQSRFKLTIKNAGGDWPAGVKAVGFQETGTPTLLRTGLLGNYDAPSRGTVWAEESTGRILETELQVKEGRTVTTLRTKFKLDDRLQVVVPGEMRTKNPDGVATYSNFRTFQVQTDDSIALPPKPKP